MTQQREIDDLVREMGQLVTTDRDLAAVAWHSLTLVFEIDDHSRGMEAWGYHGERFFSTGIQNHDNIRKVLNKARDLRTAMRDDNGRAWQACLMQLVRPGPTITLDFAYDDNPWRLKAVSLDLSDHAMALRSKDHPLGESCPPSEPAVSK